MVRLIHLCIPEKRFDHVLTVIKRPVLHGETVYIGVQHGRHLLFLDGADFSEWKQDEDADILFATQAVDGGATCVAARGANDGQMVSGVAGLEMRVLADEEELEEVAEELECNIFEGEGRTVEELEEVKIH